MVGSAHWLAAVFVLGGGALIVIGLMLLSGRRHRRLVQQSFHCPYKDADVEATFSASTLTDRLVEIERCSYFDPPERIPCQRKCVDDYNARLTEPSALLSHR